MIKPKLPNVRRGYVDTTYGQVHYRAAGTDTDRQQPLVLIHQSPGSSAMWHGLLPELAARGRHAIAFDLPGYGLSDPLPGAPGLGDYAKSLQQAAGSFGLETFDILGHHTGASVALWMLDGPTPLIGRLVLYGIALLDPGAAQALANEASPVYDAQGEEITRWWRALAPWLPADRHAELMPRYAADMLLAGKDRVLAHHAVGRGDHADRLRALTIPTLAIQGRRDVLYEATRRAADLSDAIEFRAFGDAGIFVADEYPAQFAALVDDWLGTGK